LEDLVGMDLSLTELEETMPNLKCEWVSEKNGLIELEVTHDRPDLLSSEGIARSLRSYLGLQKGLKQFNFPRSGKHCKVEKSVLKVRPFSRMFTVKNVFLSDALIEQLMQLQEKIHLSYTRGRRDASIGVYDLNSFEFPLTYCSQKKLEFTPLNETKKMSAEQVLKKTEKGREYAHLVKKGAYPVIKDKNGLVLSMPPVLNSEETRLKPSTRNLFVDVSGEDEKSVKKVATLMAVALSERGSVETLTMKYPGKSFESPELEEKQVSVEVEYVNKRLGTKLSESQVKKALEKNGFHAVGTKKLEVKIPCYRFDLMHPIDLVEEVAMSIGYNELEPVLPKVFTVGSFHPLEENTGKAREVLVGAGFQEVLTYILSSKKKLSLFSNDFVQLKNPVSDEHDAIRQTLLPGILDLTSKNKHHPLPHKVFEAGDVVEHGKNAVMKKKIAAGITDSGVTFTHVKSLLDAFSSSLGFSYSLKKKDKKGFIKGRVGEVTVNRKKAGFIGEIHPQVLNYFSLEQPVAVMELDLEVALQKNKKRE
jgi:phenylalanyl-tRNA synthetase beta chain